MESGRHQIRDGGKAAFRHQADDREPSFPLFMHIRPARDLSTVRR